MARTPALKRLLAGCLLLTGAAPALAQSAKVPPPETLLHSQFNPKQKDVVISTPAPAEVAGCKVELVQGSKPGSVGYLLVDANKKPLRRFMGGVQKPIEIYSYYRDGVEVYREIDSNGDNKPDQYRWLNGGGMKWGVDLNQDGKIDAWRMISAEEVGKEAFQALVTHDFDRLKALFLTEAEMAALKLPANQVARLANLQKQAAQKFEDVCKNLPQLARANFVRVETAPPSCVLGEHLGGEADVIKYASRSILYEVEDAKKDKKHEWLSTGEMIQVGPAWRLVDVPTAEDAPGAGQATPTPTTSPELTKLLDKLTELDNGSVGTQGAQQNAYFTKRIQLVQEILQKVEAKDQETWYKQLFDNYATMAQNGEAAAGTQLDKMSKAVAERMPRSSLAAYGAYRVMWTRYALDIGDTTKKPAELAKVQEKWLEQLENFVQTYPNAEDTTPEALHQLAMGLEFAPDKADVAKRWYKQIYTSFPQHILAEKARGCERRLDLVGKPLELTGTQLNGNPFNIADVKGKMVVVYYWSTAIEQSVGDFARLRQAHKNANGKLELVCVNLDDTPAAALEFLKTNQFPGIHLGAATGKDVSGLSSPLAVQYGINGLPTMFLVGRDGKVISTRLQIAELDSEVRKTQ